MIKLPVDANLLMHQDEKQYRFWGYLHRRNHVTTSYQFNQFKGAPTTECNDRATQVSKLQLISTQAKTVRISGWLVV